MLDRVCPDVAATLSPVSDPRPALPRTQLDDVHTVLTCALPPTRARALRSAAPTDDTQNVMLTDPVVGAFVVTTLLTASDTPA